MKEKESFVSIIIPCRGIDEYARECIKHCLKLEYKDYEILLLPDKKPGKKDLQGMKSKKLRIIATGSVMPAIKRNLGMKKARGRIYAFIDSDAYPAKDWLKNAAKHLKREGVGLVGGPNLTPPNNNFRQKISGMLLAAYFCGGRTSIRYRKAKEQETIELPSCNFVVKKELASRFEPDLLTAEDTRFCFNIWKKGSKVLYSPDIIVYHHRRPVFKPHLRQMWIYGRDIALLLKRKNQFSLSRIYYSMLSLFVLGTMLGAIISFFSPFLRSIYFSVLGIYLFLVLISSLKKDLKTSMMLFLGIISTHFAYGLGFLYGLLSKSKEKLNTR